ncbi:hypothetical protein VOLCADRAFT_97594 [Volvox carteri f. nagariensis]|uniref:SET domain-containing protein n=1 Tax=Volvox carteri f. nagariensis TaxID=3068 RepID=D8UD47_VOLCA|nr:uncharacterized protein VOLCADRAFT_97594 [Volvox carteri f. nagariensis]EFJ42331.1 hypothetical protein VOLCADRAFT_97594 [Volvox carteri f. nagariensis]|eukprot:XP_002956564.1 hypothetical protein VOLCADRAFT_97594 [Volvox carteri f. nagariensis]
MKVALSTVRCATYRCYSFTLPGWLEATSLGALTSAQDLDTSEKGFGHPPIPGRARAPDKCIFAAYDGVTNDHREPSLNCTERKSGSCCHSVGRGNGIDGRVVSSSKSVARRFSTTRKWVGSLGASTATAAATATFSTQSRPNADAANATEKQQQRTPPAAQPSPPPLPQRPSAADLLGPILKDKPFTVAQETATLGIQTNPQLPGRGRGLVAVGSIPRGQVVHREVPLVAFPELGATHGVCYHCLAPLTSSTTTTSPVRHSGPNRRRFCCDSCMNTARTQYLDVEEAVAAAAAAAATQGSGGKGGGGQGGPLAQLYEQCRQHGERFPLMAARLAFMEVSEAMRQCLEGLRTQTRRKKTLVSEQQLDGRGDVCVGYGLLAAAFRALAADLAALRNLAATMVMAAASRSQQKGAVTDMDMRMEAELDPDSVLDSLSGVVNKAVTERVNVEWFVGVMARLHLNVFQVHNPLAGADPADLAAAAAALVSGSAGGASSGSAVYLVASLFNHSCEPTLELSFPDLDAAACFVAARDIAPGEELCVSYLDVGLPYNVRQRHLKWSYGFVCGLRHRGATGCCALNSSRARVTAAAAAPPRGLSSLLPRRITSSPTGAAPASAASSCAPSSHRLPPLGHFTRVDHRRGGVVAFSSHSKEELEAVAREKYGKPYDTLSTDEKKAVGGVIGGRVRSSQLGHEGYQELGHLGGEARKEQLSHEGYQIFGQPALRGGMQVPRSARGLELGHLGGEARKEQLSHEGYQETGHKGGAARGEGAARQEERPEESFDKHIEAWRHWENPETKRRVHCPDYIRRVREMSADDTKGHHTAGDVATFSPGGYRIAALAAGGAIEAVEAVLRGEVRNAYALVRPPGHHAERDQGMGFCIFNNVAVAAAHALSVRGLRRVAIVDFDVHHGNGTQHMFESDPRVMFISLHQDSNYPLRSGYMTENGVGQGEGTTLNVPLPPGSGSGAYQAAFTRLVRPALEIFKPELLLVSAGYDASYMDNLAAMILSSADFGWMMRQLVEAAESLCGGRLVALHEGGYSELYVPFCGLAALEALSGEKTEVQDPWLHEVSSWGYQELQPHQEAVVARAEKLLDKLRQAVAGDTAGREGDGGIAAEAPAAAAAAAGG